MCCFFAWFFIGWREALVALDVSAEVKIYPLREEVQEEGRRRVHVRPEAGAFMGGLFFGANFRSLFWRVFWKLLGGFWRHFGPISKLKIDQKCIKKCVVFFAWFFVGFWKGFGHDFWRFFGRNIDRKSMKFRCFVWSFFKWFLKVFQMNAEIPDPWSVRNFSSNPWGASLWSSAKSS